LRDDRMDGTTVRRERHPPLTDGNAANKALSVRVSSTLWCFMPLPTLDEPKVSDHAVTSAAHPVQGGIIYQRPKDGFINATAMCQAAGKQWFDYRRLTVTNAFIEALAAETGIPGSDLAQSMKGGDIRFQGTWVHPQVAINLAQWVPYHLRLKALTRSGDRFDRRTPWDWNGTRVSSFSRRTSECIVEGSLHQGCGCCRDC
jgi:KilA-N domain